MERFEARPIVTKEVRLKAKTLLTEVSILLNKDQASVLRTQRESSRVWLEY